MEGKAERIVAEYEEHQKRSKQEMAAAKQTIRDAVSELRGLFCGKAQAFDGDKRLRDEIRRSEYGWGADGPGVRRCVSLVRIAKDLDELAHYTDDLQAEVTEGEEVLGKVLLIRGWCEWYPGEWDDKEVEVPVEMLDMSQEEINALYEDAGRQAATEIAEATEEARIMAEEQERWRYLELKAKYENADGIG